MAQTVYTPLASVDFDKILLQSVDRLTFYDRSDNSILLMLDDLKNFTITNSVDTTYQTGKLGVRLAAFDRNKTVEASGENAYIVASAMAAQTGSDVENATASDPILAPVVELLTVGTGGTSVTTSYAAVGATGTEIPFIYKANKDLTQGQKYPIASTASATEFSYDPTTKVITLPTGVFSAGDVVIVSYEREATVGKKITNDAETVAKSGRCIMDCTGKDLCNDTYYHVYFVFENVKIDGNFDISLGDDVATGKFGFAAMPDICSVDKSLYEIYIV